MNATVPHRTGSPTPVDHMTTAVAAPTSEFIRGNCEEIGGNIAFDLLRDIDRLPLAGEPGQDLDQPPQETVPRNKEEVEKHHGGEQPAGEASRASKDARQNRSAVQRPGRALPRACGAEIIGRRQKCSKCTDRGIEKAQPLLNARNALRQLGYPRLGGAGEAAPSPTIVAITTRMSKIAPSALGTRKRSSARSAGCIRRLSMTAKII